jgi:TM2 domain-containing membrane protein YozV
MMDSILSALQSYGIIPATWHNPIHELPGTAPNPAAYLQRHEQGETQMSTYAYPNPQAIFYQQYEAVRRDEVVGILLALFLGSFGVHHFYLRRTGLGILYLCFCWTAIPGFLGFIECFFMPGRVREFNAIQAAGIAAALGIPTPGWGQPVNVTVNVPPAEQASTLAACPQCHQTNPPRAHFCSGCGGAL